jgi:hypothetical protein
MLLLKLISTISGSKFQEASEEKIRDKLSYRTGTLKKLLPSVRIYYPILLSTGWTPFFASGGQGGSFRENCPPGPPAKAFHMRKVIVPYLLTPCPIDIILLLSIFSISQLLNFSTSSFLSLSAIDNWL